MSDYGEFSDFAPCSFNLEGKTWPTSEHYFQAQKFVETDSEEEIRLTESPMQAALKGRDRDRKLRSDWETVKVEVMRTAVHAKLSQNKELRELLL